MPKYRGAAPIRWSLIKGEAKTGITIMKVESKLDAGPIIEQDTARISHRDTLKDLVRKGQDLEKLVLSRALRWHLERKILAYNNKTVVFD